MRRPFIYGIVVALALAVLSPSIAGAHGFGDRYDLPVPLELYMGGAGAAVVLSFVIIGLFARGKVGMSYPRRNLLDWRLGRAIAHPVALEIVKATSAGLFLIYLFAGICGTENPSTNLVPTMTWVIFWVGVAYMSALVGNVWALINPLKVIYTYAESVVYKLTGKDLSRYEPYPEHLGAWPSVALFLAFAWVEIVYTRSGVPANIVILALTYTAITFGGMWWFGRDQWLRSGEAFSLVLGFFAAFAPTEVRVRGADVNGDLVNDYEAFSAADTDVREWNVRPWGVGLLSVSGLGLSQAFLLIVMLATVSFDGFVETGPWSRALIDVYPSFSALGSSAFSFLTTAGLVLAPLLFFGVFAVTAWLMGMLVDEKTNVLGLVRVFAMSLVPIALAYHVAHFFSFLVIQGQRIIPLASDPFGWGWDLFGTADFVVDIGVINARVMWILSIVAIVLGHIIAVYVAHVYAVRMFPGKGQAVRSQYPMLGLMAGYTMVSLWIVAQPIVST
jgi:hypothetical protein